VYAPGNVSSVAAICHAAAGSLGASLAASAASFPEM